MVLQKPRPPARAGGPVGGSIRERKKLKKSNVEKVSPQKVENKQCRKSGFIYFYIPSYTFIYLQIAYIPSYTPTYIKILNIRKMRGNIKHKNDHNSGPRHPPASKFGQNDPTMSPVVLAWPKGVKTNSNK